MTPNNILINEREKNSENAHYRKTLKATKVILQETTGRS